MHPVVAFLYPIVGGVEVGGVWRIECLRYVYARGGNVVGVVLVVGEQGLGLDLKLPIKVGR